MLRNVVGKFLCLRQTHHENSPSPRGEFWYHTRIIPLPNPWRQSFLLISRCQPHKPSRTELLHTEPTPSSRHEPKLRRPAGAALVLWLWAGMARVNPSSTSKPSHFFNDFEGRKLKLSGGSKLRTHPYSAACWFEIWTANIFDFWAFIHVLSYCIEFVIEYCDHLRHENVEHVYYYYVMTLLWCVVCRGISPLTVYISRNFTLMGLSEKYMYMH